MAQKRSRPRSRRKRRLKLVPTYVEQYAKILRQVLAQEPGASKNCCYPGDRPIKWHFERFEKERKAMKSQHARAAAAFKRSTGTDYHHHKHRLWMAGWVAGFRSGKRYELRKR